MNKQYFIYISLLIAIKSIASNNTDNISVNKSSDDKIDFIISYHSGSGPVIYKEPVINTNGNPDYESSSHVAVSIMPSLGIQIKDKVSVGINYYYFDGGFHKYATYFSGIGPFVEYDFKSNSDKKNFFGISSDYKYGNFFYPDESLVYRKKENAHAIGLYPFYRSKFFVTNLSIDIGLRLYMHLNREVSYMGPPHFMVGLRYVL